MAATCGHATSAAHRDQRSAHRRVVSRVDDGRLRLRAAHEVIAGLMLCVFCLLVWLDERGQR